MIFFLSAIIHLSIISNNTRQEELTSTLGTTVEDTMNTMRVNHMYKINNVDQFMADFCTAFMLKQNANSDLTIKLVGIDCNNGAVYIQVDSKFVYPNGRVKTITYKTSLILEEKIG